MLASFAGTKSAKPHRCQNRQKTATLLLGLILTYHLLGRRAVGISHVRLLTQAQRTHAHLTYVARRLGNLDPISRGQRVTFHPTLLRVSTKNLKM